MQLIVNALIAGSFAALIAAGLSFVYGVLRIFNMALGQFALIGGYTAWWFYAVAGWPLVLAIVLSIVITGLVAWLSFEVFVGPFYRRHRFLPLVTTIALGMILDGLILLLFHEQPKSIIVSPVQLQFGGAFFSLQQLVLVLSTAVLLCLVAWILNATPAGRRIRATVSHPHAAQSIGIRSDVLHRLVFIISCVLAGLAGIYIGIDQNLSPVLAFPVTIKAYAALIAGGKESLWGTILCAYLIALIEQLAIGIPFFGVYIPAGYQSTIALLFIIVVLLVRPQGLFGSAVRTA